MPGMEYRWGITTSVKGGAGLAAAAGELARKWRVPFYPRAGKSFAQLKEELELEALLVLDRNGRLLSEDPVLEWHPSMAVPRLRALSEGKEDNFLKAAGLAPGDRVLDCTLGLAADALIAAWAVGNEGLVQGLEASPAIAAVTEWGLLRRSARFNYKKAPVDRLAARIRVAQAAALDFLRGQPEGSWDLVYFDPMFQASQTRSSAMNSLRFLACYERVDQETIREALRVCRRRVVLKERVFSKMFAELGCPAVQGGKYSSIAYGVWEKGSFGK